MDIQLDNISQTESLIKINLVEADFMPEVEKQIKKIASTAQIKGFRVGKVPKSMIQKMYGTSIRVEEINKSVSKAAMDYIKDNNINIIGDPLPGEVNNSADWENDKEFNFEFSIGFVPEFNVDLNDSITVEGFSAKIDQKFLDEKIEEIRTQVKDTKKVDEVAKEDEISGYKLPKNEDAATTILKLADLSESEQDKLVGKKVGDTVQVDLQAFTEDAERILFLGEEQKDAEGSLEFEIVEIARSVDSELNQEFFDKVFGPDTVKSLEEFTDKVKESYQQNFDADSDSITNLLIRKALLENIKIDAPKDFIKRWLEFSDKNELSKEEIDENIDAYIEDLNWSLIKEQIAKTNELKVEDEDVREDAKKMILQQFGGMGNMETMGDFINNYVDTYLQAEEGKNYQRSYEQCFNEKVVAHVRNNISIKSEELSVEDFLERRKEYAK